MQPPAVLFDLDETLVDSVYYHVLAWREAFEEVGIELSVWRIHRKVGMSGGLFAQALLRETGGVLDPALIDRLQRTHAAAYHRFDDRIWPLPGARELLADLTAIGVPWHRNQWAPRDRRCRTLCARRRKGSPGGYSRPCTTRQARSRPLHRGPRVGSAST